MERNFITIGEALNRIDRETPELLEHITDWQKIIAFRNIVVHGYDAIGIEAVWEIIQLGLEKLREESIMLLNSH